MISSTRRAALSWCSLALAGLALPLANAARLPAGPERPAPPAEDMPERFSMLAYFQDRLATQPPLLDFPATAAEVPAWREQVVLKLREILGLDVSVPVPLEARVVEVVAREGYRLEKVIFTSEAKVDVPAYVLIPDGVNEQNPAPGVLCLQGGNGGGKAELAGETENNPVAARGLALFHDDIARQMARAGFVSMTIDLRMDGERAHRQSPDPFGLNEGGAPHLASKFATLMGQTYFGLNLFDARCALDYLASRPDVRAEALGCAGFSFGGTLTAWLSALDRRIKVAALEGNWPSWRRLARRSLTDGGYSRRDGRPAHLVVNSTHQILPGFFRHLDMNLTVAAVAPTPMVISFESESPWQFDNLAEAEHDVEPIRRAYAALGKPGDLHLVHVKGGHYWRPDVIMPWFTERLHKIGREDVSNPARAGATPRRAQP